MASVEKVESALKNIQKAYDRFGDSLFLGHSGGKDSCVIHHLAKQVVSSRFKVVHNVKPILSEKMDPVARLTAIYPETLEFLYQTVCTDTEVSFMSSTNMLNFITANSLKCQIDGARRSEWARPGKSSNIIVDGANMNRAEMPEFVEKGIFDLSITYPIFDWSDFDVFEYLVDNDLPFSPEYHNNGEFLNFVSQRGC